MSLEFRLIALVALAAGLLFGYETWAHRLKEEGRQQCEAAHAQADQAERARRDAAQAEIANEAQRMAARDRDHAIALALAAPGLRGAVASAISQRPAAPASSASAASAGLVLSNVLGAAEERLRALAELADERGTAGSACVRLYESLTEKP